MGQRARQHSDASAQSHTGPARTGVVKAIREQVHIDRERVETGKVRVTTRSEERQQAIDEPVWRQVVEVERVPINRVVEGPMPVRTEGDTTIIPVLEEQVFVERRLVLKEEVRVTRRHEQDRFRQTVPLRDEQVVIERVPIRDAAETMQQPMKGESSHGKNDGDRIVPEPRQRRRNDR